MADWGLLSSLRGRKNWDTIRADKQRELQYQTVMNTMAEQDLAEQQQQQAAMQGYFDTANQLKVLPKGMERIRAIDDELRTPIIEGIKKYGGDLNKYMKVEGNIALRNYADQLLHHPTTVREILNASNANRYFADKEAGRQELTDIDPATGMPMAGFDDALSKYNTGEIDALSYKGSYKPGKTDETIFGKIYGKNRYQSEPVTPGDYAGMKYRELLDAGLSEPAAKHQAAVMANNYKNQIAKGDNPLRYKSDKWTPSKAWQDGESADISAKYIVDGWNALLDPSNTQIWTGTEQVKNYNDLTDASGKIVKRGNAEIIPVKKADIFTGYSLGKKTISYKKEVKKYNAKGEPVGVEVQTITEPVEDAIEGFYKTPNGQVLMQTTAGRLEGKELAPVTDGSIDKMFGGVSKTPKVLQVIATMRKALKANKSLTGAGRPDFTEDNAKVAAGSVGAGKNIPLSKIKSLVGKSGYEGYTEDELVDYYKSQGYVVQ